MKLESNQIGTYAGYQPTRCAVGNIPVDASAVQYGLDSKHYVLVAPSNVRYVDSTLRQSWRNEVKPSKKASISEETDVRTD